MSELVVVTVVLLVVIISGLRILQQFQRGLVFRLGRYQGTRGPGLTWNIIDSVTEPWGIAVDRVQIKEVGIPNAMQRAMAQDAEAHREKRAGIVAA